MRRHHPDVLRYLEDQPRSISPYTRGPLVPGLEPVQRWAQTPYVPDGIYTPDRDIEVLHDDPGGWGQSIRMVYPPNVLAPFATPVLMRREPNGRDKNKTIIFGLETLTPPQISVIPGSGTGVQVVAQIKWGVGGATHQAFVDVRRGTQVSFPATFWSIQAAFEPLVYNMGSEPVGLSYLLTCSVSTNPRPAITGPLGYCGPTRTRSVLIPATTSVQLAIPPFAHSVAFMALNNTFAGQNLASYVFSGASTANLIMPPGGLTFLAPIPLVADWDTVTVTAGASDYFMSAIFYLALLRVRKRAIMVPLLLLGAAAAAVTVIAVTAHGFALKSTQPLFDANVPADAQKEITDMLAAIGNLPAFADQAYLMALSCQVHGFPLTAATCLAVCNLLRRKASPGIPLFKFPLDTKDTDKFGPFIMGGSAPTVITLQSLRESGVKGGPMLSIPQQMKWKGAGQPEPLSAQEEGVFYLNPPSLLRVRVLP